MSDIIYNPAPSTLVLSRVERGYTKLLFSSLVSSDTDLVGTAIWAHKSTEDKSTSVLQTFTPAGTPALYTGLEQGTNYEFTLAQYDQFVSYAGTELLSAFFNVEGSTLLSPYTGTYATQQPFQILYHENVAAGIVGGIFGPVIHFTLSGVGTNILIEAREVGGVDWSIVFHGPVIDFIEVAFPVGEYQVRYSSEFVFSNGMSDFSTVVLYPNTITVDDGSQAFDDLYDELTNDFNEIAGGLQQDIDSVAVSVDYLGADLKTKLAVEQLSRKNTDKQLFETAAATVSLKQQIELGMSGITSAVLEVDPLTGQIRNNAFSYSDNQFTQASLLIDGVEASVSILADRTTINEESIEQATSEINLLAGEIELRATYTEVNESIAGAISAIQPAYSFGFFNSVEGWVAVNGSISNTSGFADLVWGDIQNTGLSYSADENPIITVSVERTAGSGWVGDLIVTFSGGGSTTYPAVISDIPEGSTYVRNLNLSEESTFTGTVTGVRLVLGGSASDTFKVTSIVFGKPSAELEQLEGLTAQVNELGVEIDAVNASLINYVSTAYYNTNTVTLGNVSTVLDGQAVIIGLKATQQQLTTNGTISKANSAQSWVDGATANITSVVVSFNAQPGSIDDQLETVTGSLNTAFQEIDATKGLISNQVLSINKVELNSNEVAKLQFFAEAELLKQRNNALEQGSNIAIAQQNLIAQSNEIQAVAQSVNLLQASSGTQAGQINAISVELNEVKTDVTGNARSISSLQNTVNNPTTGLSATFTLAGQAKTTADGAASSATAVTNTVNSPTNGLAATFTLAGQAKTTADGAVSSIGGLQTQVTNIDGELSSAQLLLDSTVDAVGNINSRAFLGVSSNVGGTTVVSGVTIDGTTKTMEFRADTFRLSNTAGDLQMYWDSTRQKWIFNGDLVSANFQTGTSGYRAEMGSRDNYPFWYGTGEKTLANAGFAVDLLGNTYSRNQRIRDAKIEFIGSSHMRIESSAGFGPQSLISWYGQKVNGVTWDVSTNNPIESGLLKSNCIMYLSSDGDAYFGGTVRVGTIKSYNETFAVSNNPSVTNSGIRSDGGLIVVSAYFTYSVIKSDLTSGSWSCSGGGTAPTGNIYIDRWNGSAWIQVQALSLLGKYSCQSDGTFTTKQWDIDGSLTFVDNLQTTAERSFRARVSHTGPVAEYGGSLKLSLLTEE